ncbi:DEAD/DEAH box helicase [Corynebacterium ulceribovis]|uniref:DEAD/DEAH box helicase n=1 Tax=Corynebacterium ulceribovis TaxID=487732 RepID=UPI0003774695|nr:DEAD/DEAH box helicase [Corynebacterium ulceribovis]
MHPREEDLRFDIDDDVEFFDLHEEDYDDDVDDADFDDDFDVDEPYPGEDYADESGTPQEVPQPMPGSRLFHYTATDTADKPIVKPGSLLSEFISDLPFTPDDFQLRGCISIEDGREVLVCAPTGAGKTFVGEFAVYAAKATGGKCFYTTPIKALSNQKFHDLVDEYGEDAVGLLTGDVAINGDADIVVMTTEVLRNMIYAGSPALRRLTHVVMDEIHYLADQERGPVWEEVILNLSEDIHVIGLSATVSNSEEFGRWISTVRGGTDIIVSDLRPVPLNQWMLVGKHMFPLFKPGSFAVNPDLLQATARAEHGALLAQRGGPVADRERDRYEYRRGGNAKSRRAKRREAERGQRRRQWNDDTSEIAGYRPLRRPETLRVLGSNKMLPAIVFIFSRAGCDGAVRQCLGNRLVLTSESEAQRIAEIADAGVVDIPAADLEVLDYDRVKTAWTRGVAAHHAGMLPAFRHIVEKLFNEGLVKAVFATETLALGINMPARSVLLEKLVKFNGEAHVDLTPGQYTQMTGRAGRRGIDVEGNAVVQWAPAMDARQVAGLASTRTYPLISTFRPGYNMSINLLRTMDYDDAVRLLEKSFAQYQADGSVVGQVRELERVEQDLAELELQLRTMVGEHYDEAETESFLEYMAIRDELSREEKAARKANSRQREQETQAVLRKLNAGEVIALPGKRPQLAVVTRVDTSAAARPTVISESGWTGRIYSSMFAVAPPVLGRIRIPADAGRHPKRAVGQVKQALRRSRISAPKRIPTAPRTKARHLAPIRARLKAHPAHKWPQREEFARVGEQINRARRNEARLRKKVGGATDTLGRMFDRILALLTEKNYLEVTDGQRTVTVEGEKLARIHNEADLLVAQCLSRGIWEGLDPAELAGAVSALVFENRREMGVAGASPTEPLDGALAATRRIWQELVADEVRHKLPTTREPDNSFATAMHQWTAGAPLGYCLAAAEENGAELTAGDFVRWCRQVVDLLIQVRQTGYSDEVRDNASDAITAIRRGVVALGT